MNMRFRIIASLFLLIFGLMMVLAAPVKAGVPQQQPTVAIATVTGTPEGPTARVNADQEQINVRSGPSTEYTIVGVLVSGQVVPAYGKSAAGLWVQIGYPGVQGGIAWVYSPLVTLTRGGELPVIEPPPKPTPLTTPTIDPTLAAQFIVEQQSTRLPTFTQPPPLVIPTFAVEEPVLTNANFPMGLVIVVLGVVGIFSALISVLRGQ